jgi:hypothetical protein
VTTISTTADLLRLLREDPDFRDEVRRLLLTQELIELPERFARFEAYVERRFTEIGSDITEIRGDITRIDGTIVTIQGDITEIRGDITRIEANIVTMQGDLGRLKGAEYEHNVSRSFASYASMAFRQRHNRPLRRNRLLYGKAQGMGEEVAELISDAVDNGLISDDERAELEQADAVMRGQDGNSTVYFVGEISITLNNGDIDRAISRANILGKVTGSDAWPMVIGETVPQPQRTRAEAEQVAFREVEQ